MMASAAINFKHLRPRLRGQRVEVAGLFLPPPRHQAAHQETRPAAWRRTSPSCRSCCAERAETCRTSGRPLNLYDALGITVAGSGEVQDQAGWPRGERAKLSHGLCDHRDVAFNFNLHVCGTFVETFSHALDGLGCVSQNRSVVSPAYVVIVFNRRVLPRRPGLPKAPGGMARQVVRFKERGDLMLSHVYAPPGTLPRLGGRERRGRGRGPGSARALTRSLGWETSARIPSGSGHIRSRAAASPRRYSRLGGWPVSRWSASDCTRRWS